MAILRIQPTLIYLPCFQKLKIQPVSFALQVQKKETEKIIVCQAFKDRFAHLNVTKSGKLMQNATLLPFLREIFFKSPKVNARISNLLQLSAPFELALPPPTFKIFYKDPLYK